jgi:hypothetical protein
MQIPVKLLSTISIGWTIALKRTPPYSKSMSSATTAVTTEKRPHYFRRRYFIDGTIQKPIILYFVGLIALTFTLFAVLFLKGFNDYLDTLKRELSESAYSNLEVQFMEGRDLAISIFSYCLVISMGVAFACGVFLSHRVAGPIYRLRKTLQKITADRKPHPVEFRKKDYTSGLATDFNEAMKVLEKK